MTFQLDTSGYVPPPADEALWGPWSKTADHNIRWSDLSQFTQGYIEALFEAEFGALADAGWAGPAFRDLAPEALARIIADEPIYLNLPGFHMEGSAFVGQKAWVQRQAGWPVAPFGLVDEYLSALPPLTVQLSDDGKVRFA